MYYPVRLQFAREGGDKDGSWDGRTLGVGIFGFALWDSNEVSEGWGRREMARTERRLSFGGAH